MKLEKRGDDLVVHLPSTVVEAMRLREGDTLEVTIVDARTVQLQRVLTQRELFECIRQYRGLMPADFKFNRDEASRR